MRKVILTLKAYLLFFAVFLCIGNWGHAAELKWVYYGSALDGSLVGYYSPETINCLPGGIMELWTKEVSKKKNVADMAKAFGPKFRKLNYSMNHKRLDCGKKRLANLEMRYYDNEGDLIGKADIKKPHWKKIAPGSMGEGLLNDLCRFCRKVPRR
jgi:hypothetical protein